MFLEFMQNQKNMNPSLSWHVLYLQKQNYEQKQYHDLRLVHFRHPPHHFLIFFIFLNFTVLYLTDLEILGFLRKVMGGVQKYQKIVVVMNNNL